MKNRNVLTKLCILFLIIILSTGCVKYNTTMDIHNDKSMDLTILFAVEEELYDPKDKTMDSNKRLLRDANFNVQNYDKDKYKGFIAKKHFNNIDDYSSTSNVTYTLEGFYDPEKSEASFFTVKKGLLKDTYTFKINELENDYSSFGDEEEIDELEDDNDIDTYTESTYTDSSFDDYEKLLSGLEMNFVINLGTKANSHNATKVDGTTYTWDLSKSDTVNITFDIYNTMPIYVITGILVLISVVLIGLDIIRKNKEKNRNDALLPKGNPNIPTDVDFLYVNKKQGYEQIPYDTFMLIVNDFVGKKLELIYLENKEPKYIDIPYTEITGLSYKSEIIMENDKPLQGTEDEKTIIFDSVKINNANLKTLMNPKDFESLRVESFKFHKRENSHYELYIDLKNPIVVGIDKVYKISFTCEKKPEELILKFNDLNGIKLPPKME